MIGQMLWHCGWESMANRQACGCNKFNHVLPLIVKLISFDDISAERFDYLFLFSSKKVKVFHFRQVGIIVINPIGSASSFPLLFTLFIGMLVLARRRGPGQASHPRLPGFKACTLTICRRYLKHQIMH